MTQQTFAAGMILLALLGFGGIELWGRWRIYHSAHRPKK